MGLLPFKKSEGFASEAPVKNEMSNDINAAEEGTVASETHTDLHRGLQARHITMIGMLLRSHGDRTTLQMGTH